MIDHVGPIRARQLLEHFGDAAAILNASRFQLLQVKGIGDETADSIASWRKPSTFKGELKRITEFGCHIVTQSDPYIQKLLRQIYDPPIILYVKGALSPKDKNSGCHCRFPMTTHYGSNPPAGSPIN